MSEQPPFPHDTPRHIEEEANASDEALRLRDMAAARAAANRPPERREGRTGLLVGGGLALLLLLGLGSGTAWAVTAHGDYPYQHVASGASVYAQLNMDPSMLQKMQLASFLSKMPKLEGKDVQDKATDPKSVPQAILDGLAPNNGVQDYSWAGNRYALVAYGETADIQSSGKYALVMEVKDQRRALAAMENGLRQGGSDLKVAALDDGYVVLGEDAGIKAATASGANLSEDPNFKVYTEAGDPLSYWTHADGSTSAGGVHADWSSLQLTGTSSGLPLGVPAADEARNLQLTGENSIDNPVANFGIADPAKLFGPDSAAGKQLLDAAGTLGNDGDVAQAKDQWATAVNALGDNISVSVSTQGTRVLLHGTTQQQVEGAISTISGGSYSLQELAASSPDSDVQVQDSAQGLLITAGNAMAAPTKLDKVQAGSTIGQVQLSRLPKELVDTDTSKLGSISFSVASTNDGSKVSASWDLP